MSRILAILILGLSAVPAAAQPSTYKHGFCYGLAGNPRVSNFSRVFVLGPESPRNPQTAGFLQALQAKYGGFYTQENQCSMFATAAEADAERTKQMDQARGSAWPPVEIDWIPKGSTALSAPAPAPSPAPPLAPAPAPAAPLTPPPSGRAPAGRMAGLPRNETPQPFYCQYLGFSADKDGNYPLYQNEVFTSADLVGTVQQAWQRYLEATYHPGSNGNATCALIPSDPAQQQTALKSLRAVPRTTMKVIKVSWKP
jgi:hypothetical protein